MSRLRNKLCPSQVLDLSSLIHPNPLKSASSSWGECTLPSLTNRRHNVTSCYLNPECSDDKRINYKNNKTIVLMIFKKKMFASDIFFLSPFVAFAISSNSFLSLTAVSRGKRNTRRSAASGCWRIVRPSTLLLLHTCHGTNRPTSPIGGCWVNMARSGYRPHSTGTTRASRSVVRPLHPTLALCN